MNKIFSSPLFWLISLLIAKAFFMIFWILFSGLQLAPDEAQYWTWSQHLDWGYYSKPPAIAWQIWLGTKALGNTILGVRIGAVVLSFLISLSVYFLAIAGGLQERTAFWAGVISALSPMGFFASYYATTDIGMVFFWTLCCLVLVRSLQKEQTPNYLFLGLLVGLGALFKWPIYIIWLLVLGTLLFVPFFRSWRVPFGFLVSLLGLFPSIVWNAQRGWPTFKHVWTAMKGGEALAKKSALFHGNFWDFFGAQAALLSPLFFLFLLFAFVVLILKWKKIPLTMKFCGIFSLLILVAYQSASLFQKIQGNWCVFVYPTATVFVAWFLCEFVTWGKKWGVALSLFLVALIFAIPLAQVNNVGPFISLRMNRMNECMGWHCIAPGLKDAGYNPEAQVLLSDTYQMSSLLSFYAPKQKRAYFFNLWGRRHNQFSFWPQMAVGQSGLFVAYAEAPFDEKERARHYQESLEPFFSRVTYLGWAPLLEIYDQLGKAMLIYSCEEYNGKNPTETAYY